MGTIASETGLGPIEITVSANVPIVVNSETPSPIIVELAPSSVTAVSLPSPSASGFGWVDYTDGDAPSELILVAGVRTQVNRSLSASAGNNKLAGPWANWNFWAGGSGDRYIDPRAVGDLIEISFALQVIPGGFGGALTLEIDAGGQRWRHRHKERDHLGACGRGVSHAD